MAKSAADKILDAALKNQINILKLSASEQLKAEKLLINLQQKTLNALLSKITRTAFQKKRTEDLYKAVKKITDESFSAMSASSQRALLKMGEYEVEATAAMINGSIGVDVITPTLTISNVQSIVNKSMIEGELMKDWWSKQADDFIKRFKGTMNGIMKEFQAGMIEGRTIGQMISAISPSGRLMGYTRRNVEAMVRTSFMQVASDVRQKMYEQNSDILQGTRWVSTLDMRTCLTAENEILTPNGYKPVIDLKVGDYVIGGKSGLPRAITGTTKAVVREIAIVTLENGEVIRCTPDHMFLRTDNIWVEARDLTPDMEIKEYVRKS